MIIFDELNPKIQTLLSGQEIPVYIEEFLRTRGITDTAVFTHLSTVLDKICFEDISLGDGIYNVGTILSEKNPDLDAASEFILTILSDDILPIIEAYSLNQKNIISREDLKEVLTFAAHPYVPKKINEIAQKIDNRPVSERLFDALEPFKLHIDAQAIVAKEVERYMKGETTAKDVGAYIAAHLDMPFSEVGKIIESLNTHIFVPLKKTIAEEKVLELHDSDDELTRMLLGRQPQKEVHLTFVPESLKYTILKDKKNTIISDLQNTGGTPSGTSLLSQNVLVEQSTQEQKIYSPEKNKIKTYTIDPYKEII